MDVELKGVKPIAADTNVEKDKHDQVDAKYFINHGFDQSEDNKDKVSNLGVEIDIYEDDEPPNCCAKHAYSVQTTVYKGIQSYGPCVISVIKIALLLAYIGYVAYAMYYSFGGEPEWRLLLCSIFGLVMVCGFWFSSHFNHQIEAWKANTIRPCCHGKRMVNLKYHLRWLLKVAVAIFIIVYIIVNIVLVRPGNLVSLAGVALYVLLFYITSINPAKVDWHPVFWGLALQFIFALITLETQWGYDAFKWIGDRVTEFLQYSDVGAMFAFGSVFKEHEFAFRIMPIVIFMATVISILYYLGVIPFIVEHLGRFLGFCMGTRPAESLSAVGNIFLGMTDLPLMLRPFLKDMTKSELHAIMTGGFATIAGSVLGAYISFGVPANHLLTASVMSAPAALAMSKLTYPELDRSKTKHHAKIEKSKDHNIFDAATNGATVSVKLVAAITVNVIAFLSLLEFVNVTLTWFGDRVGIEKLTLELICSYVFFPIAYFLGADVPDCRKVATLVAKKTFTNEYIAFADLAKMINNRKELNLFTSGTNSTNSWWYHNDDVIYNNGTHNITLLLGIMSDKSEVVSTYALCGFANFGSMGILLGALNALAPTRKSEISQMILRAMIAGNAACFLTGSIAGLLYSG